MMKKFFLVAFVVLVMVAFVACGNDGADGSNEETSDSSSQTVEAVEEKTEVISGENISAAIPEGWCHITSEELNGVSGEDFIYHVADKGDINFGDPFLQVKIYHGDLEEAKESLATGFGEAISPLVTGETTWYGAEDGICTQIGDAVVIVLNYECDWNDGEVQTILGSIALTNG